ncbi:MAG: helix-turn-helix domain-containing protein, partial [Puniceicoccales bacterium]|nr:helix-turn-helix domain-containing protein [Puniceicoccales bacterium]
MNALERALLLCDAVNPRHAESRLDERVRKAVEVLCRTPGERFTLEGLARQCGLSRSRFAELFREQVGVPALEFLEGRRLRRVRELLEHTSLNLSEIAEQTGFSSPFYLSLR